MEMYPANLECAKLITEEDSLIIKFVIHTPHVQTNFQCIITLKVAALLALVHDAKLHAASVLLHLATTITQDAQITF